MTDKYHNRHYASTWGDGCDNYSLKKSSSSDWALLELRINEQIPSSMTIRSKEHAEQLHFMLGQMIDESQ